MARLGSLLCLSSLVATLLLCMRIDKKGDLAKVELEEAKNAKVAEAEARAVLPEEKHAAVTSIEAVKAAGAKTWPEARDVVENPMAAKEFAKVPDAAKISGIQASGSPGSSPGSSPVSSPVSSPMSSPTSPLVEWLGAFVSDMALSSNVWSLGQAGPLIIAGKPPAFKPEGNSAQAVKFAAASGEAVKAAEIAETVHDEVRLRAFPH